MERLASQRPDCGLSRREALDFEIMHWLDQHPGATQRQLADRLGISLGGVNSRLRALAERGVVRREPSAADVRGERPGYGLTEAGLALRSALGTRFLASRLAEVDRLRAQIVTIEAELARSVVR